ncbi:MAG: C40 family peptidase [Bdellovibrionaceae bacterium]|nr:C40 family peptidase [Pseudobdellovibrionaceae bacterium]
MTNKIILFASLVILASACAPKNLESIQQASSETTAAVGCTNFEAQTYSAIEKFLVEQNEIPSSEELKHQLKVSLKSLKATQENLTEANVNALSYKVGDLFDTLLIETAQKENVKDANEMLALISALELGDQTTEVRASLQARLKANFESVSAQAQEMQVSCQNPVDNAPQAMDPHLEATALPLAVYGARFAMATAYQTCEALDEPAMTAATPDVQGIKITGKHSDGVGNKRVVGSLSSVLKTHPYYKNVNSYGASCLNPRTSPLIYDYGGKPYSTTSSSSTLNFFKNHGSGTAALGIDCSGYVFTALATAGLRMAPNKNNKAISVHGVSATMFIEPQKNGLSCMEKITVTPKEQLRAGDVVAVRGHILIIDSVGSDPFGLDDIKSLSACSKVSYKNFDFVVSQSSPSKEGIGINRFEAKDYLPDSEKMRDALTKYATYACQARYGVKNITPSLGTASIVRHKLTSECMGTRVALEQESCVAGCSQLKK